LRESVRCFAYEDSIPYKMGKEKRLCLVLHPVMPGTGVSRAQALYDAEEALGMARSVKWDILPGPVEPRGGWNRSEMQQADYLRDLAASQRGDESPDWFVDKGQDSDDEYDLDDPAWNSSKIRNQWAESSTIRVPVVDPAMFFPEGRMQILAVTVSKLPPHYVFVNSTLTPTQTKNLERVFNQSLAAYRSDEMRDKMRDMFKTKEAVVPFLTNRKSFVFRDYPPKYIEVYDRHRLVMEIFATRARTSQARAQVAIAQMQYWRTRLSPANAPKMKEVLDILHIQTGPFNFNLASNPDLTCPSFQGSIAIEMDKQKVRLDQKIKRLKETLATVHRTHEKHRDGRSDVTTIALVGYTNAGKTAIMNQLTGADLKVRNLLFQTLEATHRRVKLPSGNYAVLVDSVGFVQDLPHMLFDAFKATMEELTFADVLLHVRDVSHPQTELHREVVERTLQQVGMSQPEIDTKVIEVWNKIDLLSEDQAEAMFANLPANAVPLCAKDGTGLDMLLGIMDQIVGQAQSDTAVTFPISKAKDRLAFLHQEVVVDTERTTFDPSGEWMTVYAKMDMKAVRRYEKFYGRLDGKDLQEES